jgi:hypothetical protein
MACLLLCLKPKKKKPTDDEPKENMRSIPDREPTDKEENAGHNEPYRVECTDLLYCEYDTTWETLKDFRMTAVRLGLLLFWGICSFLNRTFLFLNKGESNPHLECSR